MRVCGRIEGREGRQQSLGRKEVQKVLGLIAGLGPLCAFSVSDCATKLAHCAVLFAVSVACATNGTIHLTSPCHTIFLKTNFLKATLFSKMQVYLE